MTQNSNNRIDASTIVIVILLIAGAVAILYLIAIFAIQVASFAGSKLSGWGADIDAEVLAAIISAFLVFALTQLNAMRQHRNPLTSQNDQQKRSIYLSVVLYIAESPFSPELLQLDPQQDTKEMNRLATEIIICGSNDVIKAFKAWRVSKEQQDPHTAILAAGHLLLTIRRDLKLNNKNISNQDLMRCIMKGA